MLLGDALIAGTALNRGLRMVTTVIHSVSDFEWVEGLDVFDPLAKGTG